MKNKQRMNILIASTLLVGTVAMVGETIPSHASSSYSFTSENGKFISKKDAKTQKVTQYVVIKNKEYSLDSSAQKYITKFGFNTTLTLGGQINDNTAKIYSASTGSVSVFEFKGTGQFIKVANKYYFVTPNYYGEAIYEVSTKQGKTITKYLNSSRNVKGIVTETKSSKGVNRTLEFTEVDKTKTKSEVSSFVEKGAFTTQSVSVVDLKTAKFKTVTKYYFSTPAFDYEIAKNGKDVIEKYGTKKTYTVSGTKTATPNNVWVDIKQVKK